MFILRFFALVFTTISLVPSAVHVFELPGNQATRNWTTVTADCMTLRAHWEYGHAAGALVVFLAFLATCLAVIRRGP